MTLVGEEVKLVKFQESNLSATCFQSKAKEAYMRGARSGIHCEVLAVRKITRTYVRGVMFRICVTRFEQCPAFA